MLPIHPSLSPFSLEEDLDAYFDQKLMRQGKSVFVGRKWLTRTVDERMREGKAKVILITGDPGIGKSTFVAHLVRQAVVRDVKEPITISILAYHACMADNMKSLSAPMFVRCVARMLCENLPAFLKEFNRDAKAIEAIEKDCESDPVSAFIAAVLRPLKRTTLDGAHCLLVDSLDEALLSPDKVLCHVDWPLTIRLTFR